jgi:hypothetical protein
MKKTLLPLLASLVLCAGAAGTVAITGALAHTTPTATDAHPPTLTKPMGPHRNPAEMAQRMKEFCADGYARMVGRLAYVETKLALTPAQEPVFAHWKAVRLANAAARRDACAAPHQMGRHDILARMAREEDQLKDRLSALEKERPALTDLLAVLTPEQKRVFDHGHNRAGAMMGAGMMDHGMMGQGMMDHGMMGHGGWDGAMAPH